MRKILKWIYYLLKYKENMHYLKYSRVEKKYSGQLACLYVSDPFDPLNCFWTSKSCQDLEHVLSMYPACTHTNYTQPCTSTYRSDLVMKSKFPNKTKIQIYNQIKLSCSSCSFLSTLGYTLNKSSRSDYMETFPGRHLFDYY